MVVVILGVLATVIIGLFSNATGDAAGLALKDNLRGIRGAANLLCPARRYPGGFDLRRADDAIQ